MKERTFVGGLVAFLVIGSLLATKSVDAIYVAVTIGFFLLCIAYAEGCGRL
jgi:succinate-acetate transporter protein